MTTCSRGLTGMPAIQQNRIERPAYGVRAWRFGPMAVTGRGISGDNCLNSVFIVRTESVIPDFRIWTDGCEFGVTTEGYWEAEALPLDDTR
jgi:hypothetical protein